MKLLITGSTGFVGRSVVSAALERGHHVRALVRPATTLSHCSWKDDPNLEIAREDLRAPQSLGQALEDIDAIIHLAADKSGDFYAQLSGSVRGTEHLIDAMARTNVKKLVLISTFSVYDFAGIRIGSTLTEDSPLEDEPLTRDDYCRSKLIQENTVRKLADLHDLDLRILRPGTIYGKDNLWNARLGMSGGGNRWIRTGANARLPLAYVENCAEAMVLSVENDAAKGQTINLVDDDLPTQAGFIRALRKHANESKQIWPINFTLMRITVKLMDWTNRLLFGGRAKLPQVFRPAAFQARCRPLRYSNERAKRTLNWTPRYSLAEALARCCKKEQPHTSNHEQKAA